MYISKIEIQNYRNFRDFKIDLKPYSVIVGANKAGKSNLLEAAKLAIDHTLGSDARELEESDFWKGASEPPNGRDKISIAVEIKLEPDEAPNFASALTETDVARFSYQWRPQVDLPIADTSQNQTQSQSKKYGYTWRMGRDEATLVSPEFLKTWPYPDLTDTQSVRR